MSTKTTIKGKQTPENLLEQDGSHVHGEKAIKLASRAGIDLLPWQEFIVNGILSTEEDVEPLRWSHSDCVYLVPRQNGKTQILLAVILYKAFILHDNIVYTAHKWDSAEKIARRFYSIVDDVPSIAKLVTRKTLSSGKAEMQLSFTNGDKCTITFITRNGNIGRGYDRIDTLIFDEAYHLPDSVIPALIPTQSASQHAQTIFTSSSVDADFHNFGQVLSSLRDRALDPVIPEQQDRLFFAEWMAPEDMDRTKEETWAYANPSYGYYMTADSIKKLLAVTDTADGRDHFDVEALGRGKWYVTGATGDFAQPINAEDWEKSVDNAPIPAGDCAVALDVSPHGDKVALVSATRTLNGIHLTLAPVEEFDTSTITSTLVKAVEKNDPCAIGYDQKSKVSTIYRQLTDEGIEPSVLSTRKVIEACDLFFTLFEEGKITHTEDVRFTQAAANAKWRSIVDGRARLLDRIDKTIEITPLVASTLAVQLLVDHEIPHDVVYESRNKQNNTAVPVPVVKYNTLNNKTQLARNERNYSYFRRR